MRNEKRKRTRKEKGTTRAESDKHRELKRNASGSRPPQRISISPKKVLVFIKKIEKVTKITGTQRKK